MFAVRDEFPGYVDLESVAPRAALAPVGPFKSKYKALFMDDLDAPGPEFEFLIDELLTVGDKSVVGGPSGSGKSFLAIHGGMCISTGMKFFGRAVKQGLVIYYAGEGARGVKKRLRAWRKHFGVEFSRKTPFVLLQAPVNLFAAEGDTAPLIEEIIAISRQFDCPLRLIVIDTLATAAVGAEENSSRDMGMLMANVGKLNEVTQAHVCIVHHMNASGEKLRGSTAIFASLDNSIFVKCNETKVRTVRLGKQKDEESEISFEFELMRVEIGYNKDTDKPVTSCVCLPVGEKEAIRRDEERKGWRLSSGEEVFMRALFEADKRSGAPVPPDWDLPPRVRSIVLYEDVKRIWSASIPSDELSPEVGDEEVAKAKEARKKLLQRRLKAIREPLAGSDVIGFRKETVDGKEIDYVWWSGKPLRAFPWMSASEEVPASSLIRPEEIPF